VLARLTGSARAGGIGLVGACDIALASPDVTFAFTEVRLGLAPAMIHEPFDVLAELRDGGVTILLVDQMAALALTVADRGYVLESGRIVRDDTAQALAHDPALEAAYLGRAEATQ